MQLRGENREGERALPCKTKLLLTAGIAAGWLTLATSSAHADDAVNVPAPEASPSASPDSGSASSGGSDTTSTSTGSGSTSQDTTGQQSGSSSDSTSSSSSQRSQQQQSQSDQSSTQSQTSNSSSSSDTPSTPVVVITNNNTSDSSSTPPPPEPTPQQQVNTAQTILTSTADAANQTLETAVTDTGLTSQQLLTDQPAVATIVHDVNQQILATTQAIESAQTAINTAAALDAQVTSTQATVDSLATAIGDNTVPALTAVAEQRTTDLANAETTYTSANEAVQVQIPVVAQAQTDANAATAAVGVAQQQLTNDQATLDTANTDVTSQTAIVATDTTNRDTAQAAVDAAGATPSVTGLTTKVYNSGSGGSPAFPSDSVTPNVTTTVANINANWGSGSVQGANADHVIVQYSGTITSPTAGNVQFRSYSDDGFKLIVDNRVVINQWRDQGPTYSAAATVNFSSAQTMSFLAWYYENGGGAVSQLQWNTGAGWTVVPSSAFSHGGVSPTLTDALTSATTQLAVDSAVLNQYLADQTNATTAVASSTATLETAQATQAAAATTLTTETATLSTLIAQKDVAETAVAQATTDLQTAQTNLETLTPIIAQHDAAVQTVTDLQSQSSAAHSNAETLASAAVDSASATSTAIVAATNTILTYIPHTYTATDSSTLAGAIMQANETPAHDVIVVSNATLTTNLPTITNDVTIHGAGQDTTNINADGHTAFTVRGGAEVTITDLTISNASTAIDNSSGDITLNHVTITNADTGISQMGSGVTSIDNSTITNSNVGIATDYGSTPPNVQEDKTQYTNRIYVNNSTLSNNDTAISTERFVAVDSSTFTDNGTAASLRGNNQVSVVDSTFIDNNVGIETFSWQPTTWGSVDLGNRTFTGNTFTNNGTAIALNDYLNNGTQSNSTALIDSNTFTLAQGQTAISSPTNDYTATNNTTNYSYVNIPTNVQISQGSDGDITLTWDAPIGGTTPERYAVMWTVDDVHGWGVASYTNSITLDEEMFASTAGLNKVYKFRIRSDQDTLHLYSDYTSPVQDLVHPQTEGQHDAQGNDLPSQQQSDPGQSQSGQTQQPSQQQDSSSSSSSQDGIISQQQEETARLAAIAEQARIAAEQAAAQAETNRLAAIEAARIAKAQADEKAAADEAKAQADKQAADARAAQDAANAKAEADAKAAQEAADKATADKAAADAAAAKAEADAKAAADAATAQAAKDAQAAADAAKAEQAAKDQAAKDAQAQADAAKAEADKAAADKQAADQAAKDTQAKLDAAAAEKAAADKASADAKASADKAAQDAANTAAEQKAAETAKVADLIGVKPNSPDQLSDTVVKEAPKEVLVAHVQVDKPGVENGGIEFFGTKSAPQVVGEDGKLTPPAPPPGSGLPIPPEAITTADTFIGQAGGTTFNSPDVAVPVIPKFVCETKQDSNGKDIHVDSNGNEHTIDQCTFLPSALNAIPGAGAAVQAVGQAFAAMSNIGNDMSPVTRKKAKKILVITVVVGQIAALRRRFGA